VVLTSRKFAIMLGMVTAASLLYLAGFIPIYFFVQDSPNPPVGRDLEHALFVVAGFAMAAYMVCSVLFLAHAVGCYPGGMAGRFGWIIAIIFASPIAMIFYWPMVIWRPHRRARTTRTTA